MTIDIKKAAALGAGAVGAGYGLQMIRPSLPLRPVLMSTAGGAAVAYLLGYSGADSTTGMMAAAAAGGAIHAVQYGVQPLEPTLLLAAAAGVGYYAGCELNKMLQSSTSLSS